MKPTPQNLQKPLTHSEKTLRSSMIISAVIKDIKEGALGSFVMPSFYKPNKEVA